MSEQANTGFRRETRYKGRTITISDSYYFTVDWDADDAMSKHYESMSAARKAIDELEEKKTKAERMMSRQKTAIPVVLASGADAVVSGIHASRGTLLTKPASDGYAVFPQVDWLQALLVESQALHRRIQEIGKQTNRFAVSTSNYGARGRDIEDQLEYFKTQLDEATAKARAVTAPQLPLYKVK